LNIADRYSYEGPRTPKPSELEATMELVRSVFFKDDPSYWEAAKRWPMSLRPDLRENLFVMLHEGHPVSMISRVARDLVIHGHTLRMGFVGSVCTHPDHRGRGLAGTVLAATMQRYMDINVDFVYISGARPLYYRTGANHISGSPWFSITADARKPDNAMDLKVRQANVADAEMLYSLTEGEQTYLVHDRLDYEMVIQSGHCKGSRCDFQIIESGSTPVAYVAVRNVTHKEGKWSQEVIQFAGDRAAILWALIGMAKENGSNGSLNVGVLPGDDLINLMNSLDIHQTKGRIGGTVKVVDFVRTMEKLRPYFGQKLGNSFAESLEFTAGNERYVVTGEGGALEIDGESNMLWTLLGAPPDKISENVRATGIMKKALEVCLPITLPPLTLNTV